MKPKDRIVGLLTICGEQGCASSVIQEICGLWMGTMYLALTRLEREGKIVSDWDAGSYPRRRRYWLARFKPQE